MIYSLDVIFFIYFGYFIVSSVLHMSCYARGSSVGGRKQCVPNILMCVLGMRPVMSL